MKQLLHSGATIFALLQSGARAVTKREVNLLQSGAGIEEWGNSITKWGRYYKVGQLLQIRVVQSL